MATAAHCIIKARMNDITVYLGELDTQDTGKVLELAPAELHRVFILIFSLLYHNLMSDQIIYFNFFVAKCKGLFQPFTI